MLHLAELFKILHAVVKVKIIHTPNRFKFKSILIQSSSLFLNILHLLHAILKKIQKWLLSFWIINGKVVISISAKEAFIPISNQLFECFTGI